MQHQLVIFLHIVTFFILFMGKKTKACVKKCEKHTFSLKPVRYMAYYSREFSVSFCQAKIKSGHIIPKFNKDRKHYTAAFTLPIDECNHLKNDALFKIEHQRLKQENSSPKSEMLIPKPKSRNSYCHVCLLAYDDYLGHIQSSEHHQAIHKSKFNMDIEELSLQQQRRQPLTPINSSFSEQISEELKSSSFSIFHSPCSLSKGQSTYQALAAKQSQNPMASELAAPVKSFQCISEQKIPTSQDVQCSPYQMLKTCSTRDAPQNMNGLSPMRKSATADFSMQVRFEIPIIVNKSGMMMQTD